MVIGRTKKIHFAGILCSIQKRIAGWKANLLSQGARLVLIKHVLTSLPIYSLSSTPLHIGTHYMIEQAFANLFWGSTTHGKKRHWKSWQDICKPQSTGGLGIMSLRHMEIALRVKMLWSAIHNDSLWASYFRAKYLNHCHIREANFKNMKGLARRSWLKAKDFILQHKKVIIGNGVNTSFWYDNWLGQQCLNTLVPEVQIPNPKASVRDILLNPSPDETDMINTHFPSSIQQAISSISLNQETDLGV